MFSISPSYRHCRKLSFNLTWKQRRRNSVGESWKQRTTKKTIMFVVVHVAMSHSYIWRDVHVILRPWRLRLHRSCGAALLKKHRSAFILTFDIPFDIYVSKKKFILLCFGFIFTSWPLWMYIMYMTACSLEVVWHFSIPTGNSNDLREQNDFDLTKSLDIIWIKYSLTYDGQMSKVRPNSEPGCRKCSCFVHFFGCCLGDLFKFFIIVFGQRGNPDTMTAGFCL